LTTNATNEINSIRSELEQLINEFELLKIKMQQENSDEKIDEEKIDAIISLIDDFITNHSLNDFRKETFSSREINNFQLSINWDCEVQLEEANIEVGSYFCNNFVFDFNVFCNWTQTNANSKNQEQVALLKFIPRELFDLISDIVNKSVRDIDTRINITNFDDFECEMDSYKKIDVTDITIESDVFVDHFEENFDFDRNDIENIIKNYHNFKSEEISE
jgi:cob(I)alamin adenosyltransferase